VIRCDVLWQFGGDGRVGQMTNVQAPMTNAGQPAGAALNFLNSGGKVER
jgi:hypothetical protein